ncbi:protein twisted gastrulation-like protein [Leptotrombidium deliense]|uniref:Protein twisted gastrulation-like protein n=1 Tax=Leptotrombidium deliense TaxID=299467 RepID=A0A443SEY3_9ACAR|nr:protein twisted gastrulation-like protein [Leptotrombidium deliense]
MNINYFFVFIALLASLFIPICFACNEAVCASIVSKCMLTQSCKCDLKTNSSCSRDCFFCLDYLYTECCSCVEMCPKPNETESILSSKSHVETLPEPMQNLFDVLTEDKDPHLRWTSETFPVQISFITSVGTDPKEIKFGTGTKVTMKSDGIDQEEDVQVNCTVAYMAQCMSWNKCKSSCRSMGATSYRWFHDGCCECVGANCVNYGINESKCLQCPFHDTNSDSETNFENVSNGEGNEDENHEDDHSLNVVKKPVRKEHEKPKIEKNDKESDMQNSVPKKAI